MANDLQGLRLSISMAPVIPVGVKPTSDAVAHRLLKREEIDAVAKDLEAGVLSADPKTLLGAVYENYGFNQPQYSAAILGALRELRNQHLTDQVFTQIIDENTPVMDIIRINGERIKTYPGGKELFVDAFLPYSADLSDSDMTQAQKANASNVFVWYASVFYPACAGVAELVGDQCLTLNEVSIELRKSLDKLIPKPDFDFSRFGKEDEIATPYQLQAIGKAINEEILFPNRFTGHALNFLVGEAKVLTTPANRKITFFEKDCPFTNSYRPTYASSKHYFRYSSFEETIDVAIGESENFSQSYQLDRLEFLDSESAITNYIRARLYLHFSESGDPSNGIRNVFHKIDEDIYLSRSDLEQATEAMLERRMYDSYEGDNVFQLKTFFKTPCHNVSGLATRQEVSLEFIRARSMLIAMKNSDFPLTIFDDFARDAYNSGGLRYGSGIRLAVELLLLNMEEEGLLNALHQRDSNEFARIFKERITGDDFADDARKVGQFNALLKDAASDVLDSFTYENLDHVPKIPQNWRDMKLDWKPVESHSL